MICFIALPFNYPAPSGTPLYLSSGSVLSRSIQLTWSPPAPHLRNGDITEYTVSVKNTETNNTRELSTSRTSRTVSTLTPYVTYQFQIAAETAAGQGPFTQELSVTTAEDGT